VADSLFLMLVMGGQLELPLHSSFNVKVKKEKLRKAKKETLRKAKNEKTPKKAKRERKS